MVYMSFGEGEQAFVWAHGWGQSRESLLPLAQSLSFLGKHYVLDLPGFGASPMPQESWTVGDYAQFIKGFINSLEEEKVIWVGHSFGSRIGIKMGAMNPAPVQSIVLLSAAGLPRKRSLWASLVFWARVYIFKFLKFFIRSEGLRERLRQKFGSADYKNAGPMRTIFMNLIRENLEEDAKKVSVPALLVYGARDNETPPDIGERFSKLMPRADFKLLDDFDHYTILEAGKHQVGQLIRNFVSEK